MSDHEFDREEPHKHYNGICKHEFERGYNFGKRDSYSDILETGEYSTTFEDDTVVVRIPREVFAALQQEAERTA